VKRSLPAGYDHGGRADRSREKEIQRLQVERSRVEASQHLHEPGDRLREAGAADLSRDSTPSHGLQQLVHEEAAAERGVALEGAQSQFKIQDRARVPAKPLRPLPLQVILTGLGIGLALGAAASFVMEFMDNSVRSEEEFQTAFPDLPLLASIPDLDGAEAPPSPPQTVRPPGRRRSPCLTLAFFS
jgi:hypothetical protein